MSWPNSLSHRAQVETRRLASPSDDLAVQLDEVLLDLRVDSADENDTVLRIIRGMTDYFAHRTGWVLAPASFESLVGGCRQSFTIERGPLRDVEAIFWWDCETLTWQALDPDTWIAEARGREFDIIFTDAGYSLLPAPSTIRPLPVRVHFSAGFDSPEVTETSVNGAAEDGMILSLKALIAVAYENREAGGAAGNWSGADPSKDFLLGSYRKFW